jgi:hypothetical protein
VELLFVLVIAAGIGLGIRYVVGPRRSTYGVLLIPAISVIVTAIVWVALLWLGQSFDGGWIWAVSLVVGPGVALLVALTIPQRRERADRALLTRLSGGKA